MPRRRKPISFDTTLRNPERIPQFISILSMFEGKLLDDKVALDLEGEIIRHKIFEPTQSTLGTYIKHYTKKFSFDAEDQSSNAISKVSRLYQEWLDSSPCEMNLADIRYLLKNTITAHKERGWKGGWESRIHTQYNFLNELGFVHVVKDETIKITETGHLMIKKYREGMPVKDEYDESFEQSAFLMAFAKYQINNPYRANTINVNFFPLVLQVILYLDEKYNRPGISRQDLPFIIAWGNNDYATLAEYIYKFRKKFKFNTSDDLVYTYAMNLLDDTTPNDVIAPASKEFIDSKKKDYKFDKIMVETPDEVIRKLRLTMLISLRGNGYFIDVNHNEIRKINYVIENYSTNKDFDDTDFEGYQNWMGKIDESLMFVTEEQETEVQKDSKTKTIEDWAIKTDWEYIKNEMIYSVAHHGSSDMILKYIKEPVRFEFLVAIAIKKALPNIKIVANYKADDQGIPFNTANGSSKNSVGADIDVYENTTHALLEPTISTSRSFQVEHELPSIHNHLLETYSFDSVNSAGYNKWFALFIAHRFSRTIGSHISAIMHASNTNIYAWMIDDFIEFSKTVNSINDYCLIRDYAVPQQIPSSGD